MFARIMTGSAAEAPDNKAISIDATSLTAQRMASSLGVKKGAGQSPYDLSAEDNLSSRRRSNIPYSGFGYALQFLGLMLYSLLVGVTAFPFELFRGFFATRRDMIEKSLFYASLRVPFLVMLQHNLRPWSRLAG